MTGSSDFDLGNLFAQHEGSGEKADHPFTILVVCTGNICRSPVADQLLAARFKEQRLDVRIHSAGTGALVGNPMTEQAAALSTRFGGEPAAHRARQVTGTMVRAADLVLTASREHRSSIVSAYPQALKYTFTLNQFARIVQSFAPSDLIGVSTAQDLVAAVAAQRGVAIPLENPEDDDIVDPYRREQSVYESSARVIDGAVNIIVSAFALVAGQ